MSGLGMVNQGFVPGEFRLTPNWAGHTGARRALPGWQDGESGIGHSMVLRRGTQRGTSVDLCSLCLEDTKNSLCL